MRTTATPPGTDPAIIQSKRYRQRPREWFRNVTRCDEFVNVGRPYQSLLAGRLTLKYLFRGSDALRQDERLVSLTCYADAETT